MKKLVWFLLLCGGGWAQELDEFFQETEAFRRAHVGICIMDLESKQIVYSRNEEQFFIPASVQKVVMSAAAIGALGEEYCFHTDLEIEGKVDAAGVLHGNLWVRGGGDPTLSLEIFSEWEEALKQEGIRRIEGKIIVDTSCFETILASPYWSFEDLGNYYGAGASGLAINRNQYRITFQPGKQEGQPATVLSQDPPIPQLIVRNEVKTGAAGSGDQVNIFGAEYSPIQFYRGSVPVDEPTFTVKGAIPDPALFCGRLLLERIPASEGIEIIREKPQKQSPRKQLSRKNSPPLKEIIREMNLFSINLHAEHLLKTIGGGKGSQGTALLESFLKERGIAAQVKDGSGGARNNLLTPQGVVTLLADIHHSPACQTIKASLPEPGKEGSLKLFPPLTHGKICAKTGSMSNIQNLAGYLKLNSGKEYVFCFFCNQYKGTTKEIRKEYHLLLEQFCENVINSSDLTQSRSS
jgi:D-alanyl-D-alanine carboxypeptidase/D-alanyl-D-alanine-endopeptidase (penicillin-binding protein 4)